MDWRAVGIGGRVAGPHPEIAVEKEVESLIGAARNGDLSRRIALDDKQGFFLNLGTGINELVETLSAVFDEIASVMGRPLMVI